MQYESCHIEMLNQESKPLLNYRKKAHVNDKWEFHLSNVLSCRLFCNNELKSVILFYLFNDKWFNKYFKNVKSWC